MVKTLLKYSSKSKVKEGRVKKFKNQKSKHLKKNFVKENLRSKNFKKNKKIESQGELPQKDDVKIKDEEKMSKLKNGSEQLKHRKKKSKQNIEENKVLECDGNEKESKKCKKKFISSLNEKESEVSQSNKKMKKLKKFAKAYKLEVSPETAKKKGKKQKKDYEIKHKNEESDSSFNIDSYPSDSEEEEVQNKRKLKKLKRKKLAEVVKNDETSSSSSDDEDDHSVSSFDMDSYPSDEDTDEEKRKGKPIHSFPSDELNELENRTIFIGNLPKTIERHELKKWFSRFGQIECVRLRCAAVNDPTIPKKVAVITKNFHSERNNISAFIRFKNLESVENSLQANGAIFNNFTIRVDHAVHKGSYDSKKSVFIGNLPLNAEEDELRNIFTDCGDIESVRIIRDKATGIGKGFGFINFNCSSSVSLALKLEGQMFGKRELRVCSVNYKKKSKKIDSQKSGLSFNKGHKKNFIHKKRPFYTKNKDKGNKKKENKYQGEIGQRRMKKYSKKKFIQSKKRDQLSAILTSKKEVAKNI